MARSPEFERYARDGALVLGGGAAILLQVADPVVARGVAQHSAFADDPMRRLRHTLGYVYGVTLGDEPQAAPRGRGSSIAAHAGIPGATDPDRQLWVAATLYRTGVDVLRAAARADAARAGRRGVRGERRPRHVAAAAAGALARRSRGIRAVLDGCGGSPRGRRRCARGGPRSAAPGARPRCGSGPACRSAAPSPRVCSRHPSATRTGCRGARERSPVRCGSPGSRPGSRPGACASCPPGVS